MTQHKKEIPKWLARIQEQSWEPEILISGIVLLALFQLPPKFIELREYLICVFYLISFLCFIDRATTNLRGLPKLHLLYRNTPENRESIPYLENGIVEFIKQ